MGREQSPMPPVRTILHVDMDAFFASVEQLDHPELRGKPVLVGGTGPRGVVAAASYEARVFGCHSAQPTAVARRLCPHAVIVKGSFHRYKELSAQVFAILESFTPLVQPISIDEAFMDVTGSAALFGDGRAIATAARERVKTDTGLTCSVGVAPNKFLAKLASDLDKPDGLVVLEPETFQSVLDPLPVTRIWGVGPSAEKSLARLGVRTIADLRARDAESLRARFGDFGDHLHRLAHGLDDRPVHTDRQAKSISHEQTFAQNLEDPDEVRAVLSAQSEQVARRLRHAARFARTVTVKIRFGDFETVTRSRTLDDATDRTDAIARAARDLFDTWATSFRPVRLIGAGVSQLTESPGAGSLFEREADEHGRALDAASDAIAERFGTDAVRRAISLRAPDRHGAHGPGSNTPSDTPTQENP
ncbi:MAG: DNA polymerase IV [Phycisphaeraceae bacterium]|nr:MAG: DNA polymerase IV [Phycisphaeraceae bacterium]